MKAFFALLAVLVAVVGATLIIFRTPTLVYRGGSHPCVIQDAETLLCVRTEDKDAVYYKLVVASNGEQLIILRRTLKWKFRDATSAKSRLRAGDTVLMSSPP